MQLHSERDGAALESEKSDQGVVAGLARRFAAEPGEAIYAGESRQRRKATTVPVA